jgi:hypothetical protein
MKRIKRKIEKPVTHQQWIEVIRVNGQTVSKFYPSNAEFEKERLDMDPPPSLIYRRLNFVNGVPNEYMWTDPTPTVRIRGGHFLHRVLAEDWPYVMEQERLHGNIHVRPSPRPQPRPEAFGPCPCEACTREREQPEQVEH